MRQEHLTYLLTQYGDNNATSAEIEELFRFIRENESNELLNDTVADLMDRYQPADNAPRLFPQGVISDKASQIDKVENYGSSPGVVRHFWKTAWFRYAAVLLLIAGTATFLYLNNRPQKQISQTQPTEKPDILPGGNKAILTLSDGSTIVLDSAANGSLALQGNTKIIKLDAGILAYQGSNAPGDVKYNTISTPKGGIYQVVLPDGSQVWLNAASSIHFPTAFTKNRSVAITGEAFFEIAEDKNRPFLVTAAGTEVSVLGTSFNINAYPTEETVKTTLINGVVKVNNARLQPGQFYRDGKINIANIDQDIAWKNGVFDFNKVPLQQAMRQIANWYDVEIVYEAGVPKWTFYGKISRSQPLSKVLEFLDNIGMHCKQEGRRIIVQASS